MGPKLLSVYLTISFYQITSISWNITSFTEDGEYEVYRRPSKTRIWRRCCSKSFLSSEEESCRLDGETLCLLQNFCAISDKAELFEYCLVFSRVCTSTRPTTSNSCVDVLFHFLTLPTMSRAFSGSILLGKMLIRYH